MPSAADRPRLRALAERAGIAPEFWDICGKQHFTSDDTRAALLAAMGFEADTEEAAGRELAELEAEAIRHLLPPARVVPSETAPALALRVLGAAPGSGEARAAVTIEVTAESGERQVVETWVPVGPDGRTSPITLPLPLGSGYYQVSAVSRCAGEERQGQHLLIVTPPRCPTPAERLGDRRVFGFLANLYSVRSERNWGAGDFSDLRALVEWCGRAGGAFVGVNPLHALLNQGEDISPYRPVSRLYRNPLYLDVTAVPELADSESARALVESSALRGELARLREAKRVEYGRVMTLKRAVLRDLHLAFAGAHRDGDTDRGRAYRRYLEDEGEALADFATFLALRDHLSSSGAMADHWREWPEAYRDPRSAAVAEFRAANAEDIDFQCYLQFEIDRQLRGVADAGRAAGLPIGVYQDLALGSSPDGSDTWAFPGLFVDAASIGAPPDDYSPVGQDWGLPPMHPERLAAGGYVYWVRLIRNALRHAGALRIDHVMGMFRQFWIPAGAPAADGAYVRYPADELFAILAIEAVRAGAIIVGEDLGTVPDEVRALMERYGLLSSRVMCFEQEGQGGFKPASRYPRRALVTANTHDMVPLAGYWSGRDLDLRRDTGLMRTDDELVAARARREVEKAGMGRALAAEGILPEGRSPADAAELTAAVHAFLCKTDADLVGLSIDDLAEETEPVNVPGVGPAGYASWSRRMARTVDSLASDARVGREISAAAGRRPRFP